MQPRGFRRQRLPDRHPSPCRHSVKSRYQPETPPSRPNQPMPHVRKQVRRDKSWGGQAALKIQPAAARFGDEMQITLNNAPISAASVSRFTSRVQAVRCVRRIGACQSFSAEVDAQAHAETAPCETGPLHREPRHSPPKSPAVRNRRAPSDPLSPGASIGSSFLVIASAPAACPRLLASHVAVVDKQRASGRFMQAGAPTHRQPLSSAGAISRTAPILVVALRQHRLRRSSRTSACRLHPTPTSFSCQPSSPRKN